MRKQETLQKRYAFIVDKARSVCGRKLSYYYKYCSGAKIRAYRNCVDRIPVSAGNVHYGVGSANTFQFTFYAEFEIIDPTGVRWYIARYESAYKIETIGYCVDTAEFYELSAHEIVCW